MSSTFTVSALASGKPRPTLTWYGPRGEVLVSNSSLSIQIQNTSGSIGDNFIVYKDRRLDITSVTYYHNGTYTCVASNRIDALGNVYSVNKTMTLIVVGKFVHSCRIDLYINHSFFLFLPFIAFSIVFKGKPELRVTSPLVAVVSDSFELSVHVESNPPVSPSNIVWSFLWNDGTERTIMCNSNCSFSDNRYLNISYSHYMPLCIYMLYIFNQDSFNDILSLCAHSVFVCFLL